MPYAKGSGNKFTLRRTNRNIPVITQPLEVVEAISLCGAAEIDDNNQENLYFHIFGTIPSQMKLFLYGELYNTGFYTELGEHTHGFGTISASSTNLGSHSHANTFSVNAFDLGSHHHFIIIASPSGSDTGISAENSGSSNSYENNAPSGNLAGSSYIQSSDLGSHSHGLSGSISSTALGSHTHTISGNTSTTGLTPVARTSGTAKTYFNNLQIQIDGVDRTVDLQTQAGVASFGDGTAGHVIVTTGIELNLNPFILTSGQHKIEFFLLNSDGPSNGGKIRYNLYLLA